MRHLYASTSPLGMIPPSLPQEESAWLTLTHSTDKADPVHNWLSRQLPNTPHPPIVRPINYVKIVTVVTALAGLVTFFTVAAPYVLPVIQNRNLWAAVSLIAVLLFTSGHMFNHIRKVPYVASDGKGGVSYFAGGFQNQFGLETQIVAAMCRPPIYHPSTFTSSDIRPRRRAEPGIDPLADLVVDGVLSFATISLALKVPRMTDPRNQQIAVFVWGGIILGMYSFLLSVFRKKNGGYPFWLPPF